MAKKKKKKQDDPGHRIVARNKRAQREYEIESTLEAGIVLVGTEVKSVRAGRMDLTDGYAAIKDGELFLVGAHISPYDKASHFNHPPRRDRKLLVQRPVIDRMAIKTRERGYTIVPLEVYLNEKNLVKVRIALAKGRKLHDNREAIKRDELRREMREERRQR